MRTSTSRVEQFLVGDRVGAREADDRRRAGTGVPEQCLRVEAGRVVDAAADVGHRDDGAAGVVHELRGQPADLSEALHRHGDPARVDSGVAQRAERGVHDSPAGGTAAALRSADRGGLAGHHTGDRVAGVGGVGVHQPGHRLLVGADVRGGDVLLRADHRHQLGGVPAGDPLQLVAGQRFRVDPDTALGTAVGNADQRALPGHPHGQRADLVDVGLRVEADAALGRAAGQVVLHPEPVQDLDPAVVAAQRHGDGDLPPGGPEQVVEPVIEAELSDSLGELVLRRLPGGHTCGHAVLQATVGPGRR